MIKTILTMVVTAIAGLVGYLVSDTYRERQAQKQRDKIANEGLKKEQSEGVEEAGEKARKQSSVGWVVG